LLFLHLAVPLGSVRGTPGYRGTPVGNHWPNVCSDSLVTTTTSPYRVAVSMLHFILNVDIVQLEGHSICTVMYRPDCTGSLPVRGKCLTLRTKINLTYSETISIHLNGYEIRKFRLPWMGSRLL